MSLRNEYIPEDDNEKEIGDCENCEARNVELFRYGTLCETCEDEALEADAYFGYCDSVTRRAEDGWRDA
jgi:hypothetical protein